MKLIVHSHISSIMLADTITSSIVPCAYTHTHTMCTMRIWPYKWIPPLVRENQAIIACSFIDSFEKNGPVTVSRPCLYAQTPPIYENRVRFHLMKKCAHVHTHACSAHQCPYNFILSQMLVFTFFYDKN